ncbi:MAG: STAS domain-containing protein [Planctomycetota bacterium]
MERSLHGAVNVVKCDEKLTTETVDHLAAVLGECLTGDLPMAVVSFEKTQLFSGAGLEYLLDAREQFSNRGGRLSFVAPTAISAEVLQITGMNELIEVHSEVAGAVRSFTQ